jgi:hypothetical protein
VVNGLVIKSFVQRSEDEKQADEASRVGPTFLSDIPDSGMLHQ